MIKYILGHLLMFDGRSSVFLLRRHHLKEGHTLKIQSNYQKGLELKIRKAHLLDKTCSRGDYNNQLERKDKDKAKDKDKTCSRGDYNNQ